MEFKIRRNILKNYRDVKITEGNTVIDLGLLNDEERIELASQLKQATDELMEGLET